MTRLGRLTLTPGLAAGLLVVALAAPAGATRLPDTIDLPTGFQPEGIATGSGHTAYVGSLRTGELRAVDLRSGRQRTVEPGDGTPSVGLKLHRGRLYVAGGPDGDAKVVDARSGRVLATYDLAETGTFVNDVVVNRGAAWFTDSQRAVLYRVPTGRCGDGDATELPLTGEWQQIAGAFNANGIAATPDHRALLVVQSATGYLFRVDPTSGAATRVDLGGYLLTNGDGLLVEGRTLYAVQNRDNKVAVLKLRRDGRAGRLVDTLTSPDFDVPTTVAAAGRSLYLPNARFGIPSPETADYAIVRVRR